jgi:ABC-type proline/glycine betaine transport system ATPase subunit
MADGHITMVGTDYEIVVPPIKCYVSVLMPPAALERLITAIDEAADTFRESEDSDG